MHRIYTLVLCWRHFTHMALIGYTAGNIIDIDYEPHILWASKKDFCHLERSYLMLLCDIGYNVVQWLRCELKRDLL